MKYLLLGLGIALVLPLVGAAEPVGAPREINVTSDSAGGWVPSVELEKTVRETASGYLDAMDRGQYSAAYAFRSDLDRQESLTAFSDRLAAFNAHAGKAIERRLTKITWTKDPAQAPAPGVYAAVDLVSSFQAIDRYCGYLVLYQPPEGGKFKIMREESAFLDNATARELAQKQSLSQVDTAWAKASANCPKYPRGMPATPTASKPPLEESNSSTTGYNSVAEALADLRSRSNVAVTVENGWIIASDQATNTVWSFAPPGYPAYPAAVKRQAVKVGEGASLNMNVLCEASKQACDDLVRSFEQLNAKMSASMKAQSR